MANNVFLKLTDIDGESKDSKHKDEIEILSYSMGMSNASSAGSGSGLGTSVVQVHDMTFSKSTDKSTAPLMLACATGKHIDEGVLVVRKAGGEDPLEFMKVTLTDVLVTSFNSSGMAGANDLPVENFTLSFAKIQVEYQKQNPDGSGSPAGNMGWDIQEGKKV